MNTATILIPIWVMVGLLIFLVMLLIWSIIQTLMIYRQPINQDLMKQNRELLNRLQAPDARTFAALQSYSVIPDVSVYQPRDDEAEAKQLHDLAGVGDVHYPDDDEIRMYALQGFGILKED